MKKDRNHLLCIIITALLIALNVILERVLAFNVWNMSISFSFITVGFAAAFLGIPYAIAVAGIGDIIGALLLPFGPYFVGFTITNILMALITGIFLRKRTDIGKILISVIINKVCFSAVLNSIWISILYKGGIEEFLVVMLPRIPAALFTGLIEILILNLLFSDTGKIKRNLKYQLESYGV